jgi:transposase InsO family protein
MRQFNKFRGMRGWLSMWEHTIRFRSMRNKEEVDRRVKILGFWEEHGEKATEDAFGVSRRTLFRWQEALGKNDGHLEALDPKNRAPGKRRKRVVLPEVEAIIIRERTEHPRYGKKKLRVTLREEGYLVSESYVGRVIHDLKERNLLPSHQKLSYYAKSGAFREQPVFKRKKLRRKVKKGMELDTIIRFVDGIRRYILTAIDVEKKFAFAGAYTSHSSSSAADFLKKLIEVCPFTITELQTDNGSEFALNFEQACAVLSLTHFNTHVRSPKENAFIERFNRTISEDFIMRNRPLLRDDVSAFNEKLVDWLLWYNTRRPHQSLGMRSPLRYIVSTLTAEECHKYWTNTSD